MRRSIHIWAPGSVVWGQDSRHIKLGPMLTLEQWMTILGTLTFSRGWKGILPLRHRRDKYVIFIFSHLDSYWMHMLTGSFLFWMQGPNKIRGWGAWSTFLRRLSDPETNRRYADFLRKQGFKDFLRIPPYTIRQGIGEALVWWFHAKTGTFHLSCGEYAILPLH